MTGKRTDTRVIQLVLEVPRKENLEDEVLTEGMLKTHVESGSSWTAEPVNSLLGNDQELVLNYGRGSLISLSKTFDTRGCLHLGIVSRGDGVISGGE
jgi:hypothetical protein